MNTTKKEIKIQIGKLCDRIDSTPVGTPAYKKALLKIKNLQKLLIATYTRPADYSG
jgi:hypothetical protein